MFNLNKSEQKLLQKYGLLEALKQEKSRLDQLLTSQAIDQNELEWQWQTILSQIFDETKLQQKFQQKIISPANSDPQFNLFNLETKPVADGERSNLFDNNHWKASILPQIEHPQFTRPKVWTTQFFQAPVPAVLLAGNHLEIQRWRQNNWKDDQI